MAKQKHTSAHRPHAHSVARSPAEQLYHHLRQQQQQQQQDLINSEIQHIVHLLRQSPFFWLDQQKFLVNTHSKLIWNANPAQANTSYSISGVQRIFAVFSEAANTSSPPAMPSFLGLSNWSLPTIEQIRAFSRHSTNPLYQSNYRLWGQYNWQALENHRPVGIDLDIGCESRRYTGGYIITLNKTFQNQSLERFLFWAIENKFSISTLSEPQKDLSAKLQKDLSAKLYDSLQALYKKIDYNRCRLPKLDHHRFTDIHQGLWEFVGLPENLLLEQGVRARNPALDIRAGNIGIDFGTSSTVVAYEDENGRARLLRVGVDDFYAEAQPEHYENPTILEFFDFDAFLQAWQQNAYQPLVSWNDVHCSHEALCHLRNNNSDPKVVSAILGKIKQWALREAEDIRVRFSDFDHGKEHELAPLTLRNPVKGAKLTVNPQDPFDPIELYAWFLGLNINWRARGIFLKYYMTFPVAYPKEVKEKILSSFRRGLLRSLPEALSNNSEAMEQFEVIERASEPAAYVAAAMPAHKIEPTEEGVAYAVFDFGGGTTDFDFGYYRWATEQEEEAGIETVFEHFEAAGDKFLGGENLLENLAYRVFRDNLNICREEQISFTRPLDAEDFTGSEMLLEKTQAAYTNTLMLMSQLRSFWEQGSRENTGAIKMEFINRNGNKVDCDFTFPYDELQDYLERRISLGIENFLIAMKKAFGNQLPKQVHILLAGNSSRSRLVTDSFGLIPEPKENEASDDIAQTRCDITKATIEMVFGDHCPEMIAHAPLAANKDNEAIPTAKTGVALGILRLCPGSSVKVINHATHTSNGEAPFSHYVGRIHRKKFQVGIHRNASYQEWHKIGVVVEGVFNLFHTQSNLAHGGNMEEGHTELYKKRIDFAGNSNGHAVFARAIKPNVIELCTAPNQEAVTAGQANNIKELALI